MTVCDECGTEVDPDVTHVQHTRACGVRSFLDPYSSCDCPEFCAFCCRSPDCVLRDSQENPQ